VSFGLVLGAGGLVGIAHHVGVLRALEREGGVIADKADLIVGTSAGSAIAAYVRSGWSTDDLYRRVRDLPVVAPVSSTNGSVDLARRLVGSAYVVARSALPSPAILWPKIPPAMRRAFPAGLVSSGSAPQLLKMDLPAGWPARPLYICALDLVEGRRMVLGDGVAPEVDLAVAVQASCAIPGFYPPVRVGNHVLVDGGAYSLTNLDLAANFGCDVVVCVAPMAHAPGNSSPPHFRVMRMLPSMALRREAVGARRRGARVVLLAPGAAELRAHGYNPMRANGLESVTDAAYEATARAIDRGELADLIGEVAA